MKRLLLHLCAILLATPAFATDAVTGKVTRYQSYFATPEECVRITPLPGAEFDDDDVEDEIALCALDFYSKDIALCPKIWSTSAAVVVYDISKGKFVDERLAFQQKICSGGKIAKYVAHEKPARLKFTMNQEDTSAVNTPSSLLYYHFSRYFGFETKVPVAVWRSIDKTVLLNEVALGGVALTAGNDNMRAIQAAWRTLVATIQDPANYDINFSFGTAADLVTSDGQRLYGVMYDGGGDPYGAEFNGISNDQMHMVDRYPPFMQTPAMQALTTDAPLHEAIQIGLIKGARSLAAAGMSKSDISAEQMVFWMRELSETLMLDYILGQQDRITNFDSRKYYFWLDGDQIKRKRARSFQPGEKGIPLDAILITRTRLNDNDAAGRSEYKNHTKRQGLLQTLAHFDAVIYRRLIALDQDFKANGPIFNWLNSSLGLEADQVAMIVENTALASDILRAQCQRGALRFDLDPQHFFVTGQAKVNEQPCDGSQE